MFFKDLPTSLLVKAFPAHLVYNFMAFVFFTCQGQGSTFLKAKWDALCALPSLRAKRRTVQASRVVPTAILDAQLDRDWIPRVLREKIRQATRI